MALTNTVTGKMKYLTIGSNTYEIEGGGDVSDVTVDGTSVVTNGVAEIDSEVMIVTISYNESTEEYTADKTYAQIVSAISSGKYVVGKRHYILDQDVEDDSTNDVFLSQASLVDDFGDVWVSFAEPILDDFTKNGCRFYNISSDNGTDVIYSYEDSVTIPTQEGFALYGTCSTTSSTIAKVVTCSEFNAKRGTIIGILFTTANTASTPTLNVNGFGAKSIYIGTSTPNATDNVLKWSANTMVYFQYDGTYFRYITSVSAGSVTPSRGANTWYGTSNTGATTQAKTSTIDNFVLTKGAVVYITFSTANTYASAKITLNVSSTGAKDVYYNNAVTSSTNTLLWSAGETLTFIYSGSYWYYVGKSINKVSQLVNDSGYITSSSLPSITLNGTSTTSPSFYAPTTAGTDGYYLKSNGSGAPTWAAIQASGLATSHTSGTVSGQANWNNGSLELIINESTYNLFNGIGINPYGVNLVGLTGSSDSPTAQARIDVTPDGTINLSVNALETITLTISDGFMSYDVNDYRVIFPVEASGTIALTSDIPYNRSTTASLNSSSWSSNTQTVNVTGVTVANNVIVTYAPASRDAWLAADVYCSAQGAGTLTFTCSTTPTTNITANVLILG